MSFGWMGSLFQQAQSLPPNITRPDICSSPTVITDSVKYEPAKTTASSAPAVDGNRAFKFRFSILLQFLIVGCFLIHLWPFIIRAIHGIRCSSAGHRITTEATREKPRGFWKSPWAESLSFSGNSPPSTKQPGTFFSLIYPSPHFPLVSPWNEQG